MNSYPRSLNFWTAKVGGKLLNLQQKTGLFFAHLHKQLIISNVFDDIFYGAGVFRPFFGFGKGFCWFRDRFMFRASVLAFLLNRGARAWTSPIFGCLYSTMLRVAKRRSVGVLPLDSKPLVLMCILHLILHVRPDFIIEPPSMVPHDALTSIEPAKKVITPIPEVPYTPLTPTRQPFNMSHLPLMPPN